MNLLKLIACAAGLGAGLVAARLSVLTSARLGDAGFWQQLAAVSRLLLSADDDKQFLREYLRLWPVLVKFVARQLAVALTATTPIALAFAGVALLANGIGGTHTTADWEWEFVAAVCIAAILGLLVAKYKS
jgi:hypothetical protein